MKLKNVLLTLGVSATIAASAIAFSLHNDNVKPLIEVAADSSRYSMGGCAGGETFYIIDKCGAASGADLRVLVSGWNHNSLSDPLIQTTTISENNNTYGAYRFVVPDYLYGDGGYWNDFRIVRYNTKYSSETTLDWAHVYNGTPENSLFNYYRNYNLLWLNSYSDWNINLGESNYSNYYGPVSGTKMYFELGSWDQGSRKGPMAVYFFNALEGKTQEDYTRDAWVLMDDSKKILGTGADYEKGLFEFEVPNSWDGATVTWRNYKIVEMNEGTTTASWDNKLYESGDLTFTTKHNIIKGANSMDYSFAMFTRAKYFSQYLLNQTDAVCDDGGNTNPESLASVWNNIEAQYPIANAASLEFWNAIADENSTDEGWDKIEQAAARYDYIIGKYNASTSEVYSDFAHRVAAGKITLSERINFQPVLLNSDNTALIVLTASIAAIAAASGFFFLCRRKEN